MKINGASKLMFPQEARLANFTYASMMTIDMNIKYVVRTGTNLKKARHFIKICQKFILENSHYVEIVYLCIESISTY